MGAGLRPDAKAPEQPPDPKAGAPVLDSTAKRGRAAGKPAAVRTERNTMENDLQDTDGGEGRDAAEHDIA